MIYTVRRFSFTGRLKSGLKSAWTGTKIGAVAAPGNVILALCGKKKAALIMTGIGAGVGAGIGFYYGWKGQKEKDEYQKKLKNDPRFRRAEKEKLEKYIKDLLKTSPYPYEHGWLDPEDYKRSKLPYRPDFYEYLAKYNKFCKKYYKEWVEAWKNLDTVEEIDEEFDIVFPTPYLDDPDSTGSSSNWYIAANGLNPSDHYWIAWDEKLGEYNNNLGSGRGTGKTLLEASKNFTSQWIVDEKKIEDPKLKEVAKIHNKIIREFLKL